jgi:hypothetical protein
LAVVSATSAPLFQPLRHQRNVYHPVVNRFNQQTLPTSTRKYFFTNILYIEPSYPQKTHCTLFFGSTHLRHGRHFDYWNQPLNILICFCYLDCHETVLCCYLVMNIHVLYRVCGTCYVTQYTTVLVTLVLFVTLLVGILSLQSVLTWLLCDSLLAVEIHVLTDICRPKIIHLVARLMFQWQPFGYLRDAQQLTVASIFCVLPCLEGTRWAGNFGIPNQLLHSSVNNRLPSRCLGMDVPSIYHNIWNLLRPLQLFYFHLWHIYWLFLVYK